jgi:biotin carboxylase
MHIVLSSLRSSLEDALVQRGQDVLAIVPTAIEGHRRSGADGRYQVRGVRTWDDAGQLAKLAGDLRGTAVDSIDTLDEQCLRAAALLRSLLHVEGQSRIQALRATDKAVMKDALARADVPIAKHQRIASVTDAPEAAKAIGWPLVIKPRRGFGTLATHVVTSHAELGKLLASGTFNAKALPSAFHGSGLQLAMDSIPGGLLAEEFIDIKAEYHCEVLRFDGDELYTLPARYTRPQLGADHVGSVLLQAGLEHDAVADLARRAADALQLTHGFAHVEVLRDQAGNWLVGEIGLRPGGARIPRMLQLQHGIDVAQVAADLALGKRPGIHLSTDRQTTAFVSTVPPTGRIRAMASPEEIRRLPHVVDAQSDLRPGHDAGGPYGTVALSAHVYTRAATADQAQKAALQAAAAWRIDIAAASRRSATV